MTHKNDLLADFKIADFDDVIERYNDPVQQYCVDVLTGKRLAGRLIKLACLRQLKDLQRIDTEGFPYDYSTKATQGVLKFASILPEVDNAQTQTLSLAEFQKFILGMIEGWVIKDNPKAKRFKRVNLSMARTNGKSVVLSVLSLLNFLLGQPATARTIVISSNNITHVQALYTYIKLMWNELANGKYFKAFQKKFPVSYNTEKMSMPSTASKLMTMSANSSGGDSVHPTFFVLDEAELVETTDFSSTLTSGNVQNPNAISVFIGTAGLNPKVPFYEQYRRYKKLLEAQSNDFDRELFLCWEQDNDDEAFKPETWIKSNPLMEIAGKKQDLTDGLLAERDSKAADGTLQQFIVKNMNRWSNAHNKNGFIPLDLLESAVIPRQNFSIENREVYIGYDASQLNDDTALGFVFPYTMNGEDKFHVMQYSFVPLAKAGNIEAKMQRDGINYQDAEKKGFCEISRDRFGLIDQGRVFTWLMNFIENHNLQVKAFLYDAYGTDKFIRRLDDLHGEYKIIPVRQGTLSLNEPTKFLQQSFEQHRITTYDDHLLRTAFTNALLKTDNNGLKVDKDVNSAKIDAVDAIVDAFFEACLYFEGRSRTDGEDKSPFDGMTDEDINDYFINDFSF
ncbi:terminase TerL endonuclease subunit [Furfurilactobacillus milii]|uniref:Terminase large subunit n=1 Tax=Furfurilactobacillus rossiae TaxID=231049 RepID=A0A7C9IPL1_9LACO|nr:terminase TerL endonuclease subunit [Furfurilactobacillus milii]MYV04440.1 terminase large subunit [Furfurilactobacillus milii]